MHGNANNVGAGVLDLDEEVLAPVALAFYLVGIGDVDPAEEQGLAGGIDEAIAADRDERELFAVRAVERAREVGLMPPVVDFARRGRGWSC